MILNLGGLGACCDKLVDMGAVQVLYYLLDLYYLLNLKYFFFIHFTPKLFFPSKILKHFWTPLHMFLTSLHVNVWVCLFSEFGWRHCRHPSFNLHNAQAYSIYHTHNLSSVSHTHSQTNPAAANPAWVHLETKLRVTGMCVCVCVYAHVYLFLFVLAYLYVCVCVCDARECDREIWILCCLGRVHNV